MRAGEQWLLADDPAAAAQGFRRAIADGGPAFVDPRVPLARALFLMDRHAEAEALIQQIEPEQPDDPRICDLVAELLVERSDLAGALRWATTGVGLCLGRVRRRLGLDASAQPARPVRYSRPGIRTSCGCCSPCATASGTTSACPRTTTTGCSTSSPGPVRPTPAADS